MLNDSWMVDTPKLRRQVFVKRESLNVPAGKMEITVETRIHQSIRTIGALGCQNGGFDVCIGIDVLSRKKLLC
eukprot:scaffold8536_cov36-Cyclotella_meneghiniana.AAC.2